MISPEGCATILWKDASKASEAAEVLKLTADDLYNLKIADYIIQETYKTPEETIRILKDKLIGEIRNLEKISTPRLLASRYEKFRKIGTINQTEKAYQY